MAYPGFHTIALSQGETLNRSFTWALGGEPVDLTGYTARMQVRHRVTAEAVELELSSALGTITLGGALGTITLHVSAAVSAALPASTLVYSLELTSSGAETTPLLSGSFTVRAEVTR
ncbi:hypothetical protein [Cryobacterium sp. SO1]|uniref:hypothetical protein n=1 Tax=Cryobacterium sp. SO1 TaxID=1897061 RepID=UPI001023B5F7|nr:hypothetical protein [Cryobacterium sp. SO1]RZI35309.1 hypothetical protein BJQ95_02376 [Cryobacterium sp. SO1]